MDICLCEGLQMILFYNMMDAKNAHVNKLWNCKKNKSTKKLEEKNLKKKKLEENDIVTPKHK